MRKYRGVVAFTILLAAAIGLRAVLARYETKYDADDLLLTAAELPDGWYVGSKRVFSNYEVSLMDSAYKGDVLIVTPDSYRAGQTISEFSTARWATLAFYTVPYYPTGNWITPWETPSAWQYTPANVENFKFACAVIERHFDHHQNELCRAVLQYRNVIIEVAANISENAEPLITLDQLQIVLAAIDTKAANFAE